MSWLKSYFLCIVCIILLYIILKELDELVEGIKSCFKNKKDSNYEDDK